jgi:hypothetical protein
MSDEEKKGQPRARFRFQLLSGPGYFLIRQGPGLPALRCCRRSGTFTREESPETPTRT